jgi:arylsulfatase A-like enzyme
MDPHRPYRARSPWFNAADPAGSDVAAYDSEIAYVDSQLEEMFQLFKWQGDDTLVVVVADHGEGFGEHGSWGHSRTLFSEIVDIPLIVRPPGGSQEARRVAEPVSLIDILPTLRDFAGLPPDPRCEGRSLRGLINGDGAGPGPRQLLCHLVRKDRAGQTTRATIHDGWKWIGERPGRASLFNLVSDPSEQGNLLRHFLPRADSLEREFMAFETTSRKFSSGTLRQALSPGTRPDATAGGHGGGRRTTRDYRYVRCGRSNGGRTRSGSAATRHRYPEKMELHRR